MMRVATEQAPEPRDLSAGSQAQQPAAHSAFDRRLIALLESPRLALYLALAAFALSSVALGMGFYLDDHVGRYIYSDLPGAKHLFELWVGGYGLADGDPAHTHWQIEAGWAPWWTYDHLLIRLFRPFGVMTHWLDMHLWPDSAFAMHLHSLLWLALLVIVTTRMYRGALGTRIGGLAALLFAFDHSHGFLVGYICNRHSLISAVLGVLCLDQHLRAHASRSARAQLSAYALYLVALCSGEAVLAIFAYLCAHALCVSDEPWKPRALRMAPYFAITLIWRALYTRAGFGAFGSGLYIDPGRDLAAYLAALVERGPVLLLGQFFAPPAEMYSVASPFWAHLILGFALLFTLGLGFALFPLLRVNRMARFWLLGALASLIPAASTYPHNRQLLFASFGAMALLAQLWELHVLVLPKRVRGLPLFSRGFGGILLLSHLFVSPLAMPLSTSAIATTAPLERAPASIGDEIAGRDAVFVSAPDYFAVKLVQLERRIGRQPLARRWRALSFGPEHIRVTRSAPDALTLDYAEGILSSPFLELYRDRHLPMHVGERVNLQGLTIEVLELTPDRRARKVRFQFDRPLESDSFRFYYWNEGHFEHFTPPPLGGSRQLPAAVLEFGL